MFQFLQRRSLFEFFDMSYSNFLCKFSLSSFFPSTHLQFFISRALFRFLIFALLSIVTLTLSSFSLLFSPVDLSLHSIP